MVDEEKRYSNEFLRKKLVTKSGKALGEIQDLIFETRTGEILQIVLKNPTSYCDGLELERDNKTKNILIPFSAVIAVGDFIVVEEEELV
jgi:sporulation protein YlmC with PRC-barrel domain